MKSKNEEKRGVSWQKWDQKKLDKGKKWGEKKNFRRNFHRGKMKKYKIYKISLLHKNPDFLYVICISDSKEVRE